MKNLQIKLAEETHKLFRRKLADDEHTASYMIRCWIKNYIEGKQT
jgi:hypothetical protein